MSRTDTIEIVSATGYGNDSVLELGTAILECTLWFIIDLSRGSYELLLC